jgi:hypothetical protein
MNNVKTLLAESYNLSLNHVAMAFSLAAAIAWNKVINELINTYVKNYIGLSGLQYNLVYAVVITVISVLVYFLMQTVLDKPQEQRDVVYGV